tara:strand:- start:680 stop:1477 length:798 start_codon:yes stop_codon:yes gene_type:complete
MKIIVAGSNTRGVEDYCKKYHVPKLYSILNEKKDIEKWDDKHFLMVDSGAHSWNKETITKIGLKRHSKIKPANEFINTYFNFIKQHKDKKVIWVEFDVYGHLPLETIDEFYNEVKKLNIAGKFIRVYHPILDNGDLTILKKWINQGQDYIGIGNDSTNILHKIFSLTKDKIKIHGFAMTKLPLMEKYPFFSVDSTSPLSTVIFGRYTKPIMNFNEKKDIYASKSIECFQNDEERLENAVKETKETEKYITKLWKEKKVIWNDIKW